MTEAARYAQLILPVFWLGMVAAISFLEAPIKFRAPGVSLGHRARDRPKGLHRTERRGVGSDTGTGGILHRRET